MLLGREVGDELIGGRAGRVGDVAGHGHHEDGDRHFLCGDQVVEDVERLQVSFAPCVALTPSVKTMSAAGTLGSYWAGTYTQ
jgi:hypothetical protein